LEKCRSPEEVTTEKKMVGRKDKEKGSEKLGDSRSKSEEIYEIW
jgi:hypothetical protein